MVPFRHPVAALAVLATGLAQPSAARADEYFSGEESLTFVVDRERGRNDKILIASLFAGSVVFGGVGLIFHLDSKKKSDEVSTDAGQHSGRLYTRDLDDTRSAAIRSRNLTVASYAVGGGFLVGTFIAYLLTDPGQETVRVGSERAGARVRVEPGPDGVLVGAGWSF